MVIEPKVIPLLNIMNSICCNCSLKPTLLSRPTCAGFVGQHAWLLAVGDTVNSFSPGKQTRPRCSLRVRPIIGAMQRQTSFGRPLSADLFRPACWLPRGADATLLEDSLQQIICLQSRCAQSCFCRGAFWKLSVMHRQQLAPALRSPHIHHWPGCQVRGAQNFHTLHGYHCSLFNSFQMNLRIHPRFQDWITFLFFLLFVHCLATSERPRTSELNAQGIHSQVRSSQHIYWFLIHAALPFCAKNVWKILAPTRFEMPCS